ncbi:MAG TPA: YbaB/EbfC family nucleoid-associated protein [Armatimonadota bacterium]|nr:YbaB/EbfC family nucleoid-associated protein [Armatimonadota bacterium]
MGLGGLSGNMGRMLMKQMEEMQRKTERIQAELGQQRLEASAGGGMVTAVVNGLGEVLAVRINPEVVDPDDVEMLQDLVTAALNEALTQSAAVREERMAEVTGGLNIPGMGQLPGMFR